MSLNLTMVPPADTWLWWPLVIAPLFVALCTFLGTLAWAAAVATSHWSRSFVDQVVHKIELNWLEDAIADSPTTQEILGDAPLYCLVIRFGTDDYLASMASERERHQGRLINRVVEIDDEMILTLPVHRKLGTQFKLYYLLPDAKKAGALWNELKRLPINLPPGPAAYAVDKIVLDGHRPAGSRCWFRLAAYGAQTTSGGFDSNYFAPSELGGFERRNRLWLRWIRKDEPQ